MKRSQLPIALSVLAVFLSGILVGAFGFGLYNVHTAPRMSPDDYRRKYVEEMKARLHLDEAQAGHLNSILDKTRARTTELKRKHKPEFVAIHEDQVREIRSMLYSGQLPDYEKYLQEREKEQKARDNSQRP